MSARYPWTLAVAVVTAILILAGRRERPTMHHYLQ
jgi:hypothetical protein